MAKHNPKNERIKRQYLTFLREAKRQSEASVDAVAAAIARFEGYTRYRDFKVFHIQQAVGFKQHLAEQDSRSTGEKLSQATQYATLSHLKRFFQWLAGQPGYKTGVKYSDAEYFNLSEKDCRIATARRQRAAPTMEQVLHVIRQMPDEDDIQRRNRALVAFVFLTGARDRAVASLRLKHVDLVAGCIHQDARDVKTKFSKTFTTFFFPVGQEVMQILVNWVTYLRTEKLWGNEDPLFPRTRVAVMEGRFGPAGLERAYWSDAAPIRKIFREAFEAAGLPYFNPHSLRSTLVAYGERVCQTPEAFKAWSQNLGHEGVLTTFISYGSVSVSRQGEIIKGLGMAKSTGISSDELFKALACQLAIRGNI
ncbi:MAG: tyrosine-type recombinase/integrase [Phycisphaerales bacterium]